MLGSSILLFNSFASGDTSDALHEAISPLPTQKHKTNLVRMRRLGAVQKSRNFRQSMHSKTVNFHTQTPNPKPHFTSLERASRVEKSTADFVAKKPLPAKAP